MALDSGLARRRGGAAVGMGGGIDVAAPTKAGLRALSDAWPGAWAGVAFSGAGIVMYFFSLPLITRLKRFWAGAPPATASRSCSATVLGAEADVAGLAVGGEGARAAGDAGSAASTGVDRATVRAKTKADDSPPR